jgi:hypothetical protein
VRTSIRGIICWGVALASATVAAGTGAAHGSPTKGADQRVAPAIVNAVSRLAAVSADSATDAWAVGYEGVNADRTLVEHWDGTDWTRVESPNPSQSFNSLTGVLAFSPTDVWVVGWYNKATRGLRYRTLVIHWDGSSWTQLPSPNVDDFSFLFGLTGTSPADLWAVGWSEQRVQGVYNYSNLAMHWDGSTWQIMPTPDPDGTDGSRLLAVSGAAPDDIWAVGCAPYLPNRSTYLHWDGAAWTSVSPPPGSRQTCLTAVAAASPTEAWSVSGATDGTGLIRRWDGSAWGRGQVVPQSTMTGVDAFSPDDVWAVGNQGACCGYRSFGLHWNGHQWTRSLMAMPKHGRSTTLVAVGIREADDAWAVGSSLKNSRNIAPLIEHWDGTTWRVSAAVR